VDELSVAVAEVDLRLLDAVASVALPLLVVRWPPCTAWMRRSRTYGVVLSLTVTAWLTSVLAPVESVTLSVIV
jgi:hypothetical protein